MLIQVNVSLKGSSNNTWREPLLYLPGCQSDEHPLDGHSLDQSRPIVHLNSGLQQLLYENFLSHRTYLLSTQTKTELITRVTYCEAVFTPN